LKEQAESEGLDPLPKVFKVRNYPESWYIQRLYDVLIHHISTALVLRYKGPARFAGLRALISSQPQVSLRAEGLVGFHAQSTPTFDKSTRLREFVVVWAKEQWKAMRSWLQDIVDTLPETTANQCHVPILVEPAQQAYFID
jgi:hypothetical protein